MGFKLNSDNQTTRNSTAKICQFMLSQSKQAYDNNDM